jgi:diguanylate cyclase (GGDEF)-like protein
LKGVRGIIRVEEEVEELDARQLGGGLDGLLESGPPVLLPRPADQESSALFVPLRFGGTLIGLARLTDPLDGGEFGDRERVAAEKFSNHGVTALVNALRFRALERRSFRDPTTLAYTEDFYQDAVRNEIQKAARFGHSFSLIHVDLGPLAALRRRASDSDFSRWIVDLVEHLRSALRSADLLASRDESHYDVLLPETDAVGAAVLKQRIRGLIEQSEILSSVAPDLCEALALSAVTYPTDGTQLENLTRLVETRLERDQVSPLRTLSLAGQKFSGAIDRLLEEGASESASLSVEATRLLLREVERRPRDRGLLFLSPSEATLPVVREGLERLRAQKTRTEIVVVGQKVELGEELGAVTCVPTDRAGTDRPFALYYGEGPVYAMVTAHRPDDGRLRLFHTEDRSLVEHLAFQFQKDLGLPIGAAT